MAYFISRDKYYSFEEVSKNSSIINKLIIPVAQITENNSNTYIQKSSSLVAPTYTPDTSATTEYYCSNLQKSISLSASTTLTADQLSKYSRFAYTIRALKVKAVKMRQYVSGGGSSHVNTGYSYIKNTMLYGNNETEDYKDEDYVSLAAGSCVVNGNTIRVETTFNMENFYKQGTYKEVVAANRDYLYGWQQFYTNFYIQFIGVNDSIEYSDKEYLDNNNGKIYSETINQSPFIQENFRFNGADYIADTIFKNYSNGRQTATLEWIGSPEVMLGTDIVVEPRREYVVDNLTVYTVMGKQISCDGGYGEKLYLVRKEIK